MPPHQFIAQVSGVWPGGTDVVTFAVPSTVKPGDSLLAMVATTTAVDGLLDGDEDTWEVLASFLGTTTHTFVMRHIAAADDPATLELVLDDTPGSLTAALLVYRDLDPEALAVESSSTNIAASTNFVCPSRTLAAYSDVYLGIVVVTSALTAVTPPGGTTERHEHGGAAFQLEVFDHAPNAPGATGTKTATTGASQSGLAASIALATSPVVSADNGLAFELSPVGTIGLPVEGV